jgi:protein-S-isoprenylcysteine O-methyltransferase Ste14
VVLGLVISFAVMLLYILINVGRIKNEEKVLEEDLEGDTEYKKLVRCKVIPYIW